MPRGSRSVIIVGAGSAGCVLAARLSADPGRTVDLVEAGPDCGGYAGPDLLRLGNPRAANDCRVNWNFAGRMTSRQEPSRVSRGRLVGGSGAINGSMFMRGLPEDYESWGSPEWSHAQMSRVFDTMVTGPGYAGPPDAPVRVSSHPPSAWRPFQRAFHTAARAAGFPDKPDLGVPGGSGVGAIPLDSVSGSRRPASMTHLAAVRHRPNLIVRPQTAARRVLFDGVRAVAVEVAVHDTVEVLQADEIILCASGIGSPQLLLVSGIGPAEELRAVGVTPLLDLPGVGRNLRDHPIAMVDAQPAPGCRPAPEDPRFQVVLQYTSYGCVDRNDMQLIPTGITATGSDPMAGHTATRDSWSIVVCSQVHRGSGTVRLRSPDPLDKPAIEYRYLDDPDDRRRLREGVRLAAKLLEAPAFAGVTTRRSSPDDGVLSSDAATDDWLYETIHSAQHSSGTCRMGPREDPDSVVDERCRVRGVEGLRIVDLSIAPNVVRAPTNATAMAMAERAAELIISEQQWPPTS